MSQRAIAGALEKALGQFVVSQSAVSDLTERLTYEDWRRTKVMPHLWDEGSVVQLVFAVLIRVSERWGKKQFSEFEQRQIRILRQTLALDQPWVPEEEPRAGAPSSEYTA